LKITASGVTRGEWVLWVNGNGLIKRRCAVDVYEAIYTRKSVRAFKDKDIPEEKIVRLLEAARLAPSASNRQERRFVVVRDPLMRKHLSVAARGQTFIGGAPVVLACCAETDEHVMACGQLCYPIDVAIAIDHITLCAVAEGLGTCWIGAFDEDRVKELLAIPPQIRVVGLLPVGYAQDPSKVVKSRLFLQKLIKYERW
jgi:nitroreductase